MLYVFLLRRIGRLRVVRVVEPMIPLYVRVSMDLLDILLVFGAGGIVGAATYWRATH